MRKKIWLWALFFSLLSPVVAQQDSQDSLVLIRAPWQCDTIGDMVLKTIQFCQQEYFHSNQYIAVLEIPATANLHLQLGYEPKRTKTSVIAERHHALAAINGSFFDMEKHSPICHLRISGTELGENTPGKDTVNRKYYQYGTLVFDDKEVRIFHTDSARKWEYGLPYRNIMTAGPLLIYQGREQPMRNDLSFVSRRHNRTAIGLRTDGTILLFVVDGRTKSSEGMSLDELTATMRWLGCYDALNLDGGGSTTLYLQGAPHHGIVNHPSDNLLFDHKGERAVSNILMVVADS